MPDASSLPRVEPPGLEPPGLERPGVQMEEFEGPLDLLLDEVRRQRISIERVALAPLVGRFLEYVRTACARSMNLDIEWLQMAATLIYWKSRSLLPSDPTVPTADLVRGDLLAQLMSRRRELAQDLGRRRSTEDRSFSRASDSTSSEPAEALDGAAFVSVQDLIEQARSLERWARAWCEDRRQWQETYDQGGEVATVSGMMELLRERFRIAAGRPLDGVGLLGEQAPASRGCLFLGMLEMAHTQQLIIEQTETFGAVSLSACRLEEVEGRNAGCGRSGLVSEAV